ncbi:MAG TPA: hypothetical protein K8V56_19420 [Sporosarcina psychrophila]|uniref:Uncharacterized protein n=1 Tax=Sporosarcina psychrophila TaxID=1476 RepID=A0A921KEM6_SPOPS|nr:hypothetical protein [Sporosarcina psychrophila]
MNDWLMDSLLRSEVKKLSEEKRSLYQFIVEIEDCLVQSAETPDHFLSLLVEYSPYELAGRHFDFPIKKVVSLMNAIELELDEKIEIRCTRLKWIDYTAQLEQTADLDGEKQLFLFIN